MSRPCVVLLVLFVPLTYASPFVLSEAHTGNRRVLARTLHTMMDLQVKSIFGLQNIPWICKTTVYGFESRILGPKKVLKAASSPVEKTAFVTDLVERLFDIPTLPLPNFMCLTLTPSNQIIHPAR